MSTEGSKFLPVVFTLSRRGDVTIQYKNLLNLKILSVNNVKELSSLGKFIRDAFKLRSSLLS